MSNQEPRQLKRGYLEKGAIMSDFMAGPAPHVCCWQRFKSQQSWAVGFQNTALILLQFLILCFACQSLLSLTELSGAELDRSPRERVWRDSQGLKSSKTHSCSKARVSLSPDFVGPCGFAVSPILLFVLTPVCL